MAVYNMRRIKILSQISLREMETCSERSALLFERKISLEAEVKREHLITNNCLSRVSRERSSSNDDLTRDRWFSCSASRSTDRAEIERGAIYRALPLVYSQWYDPHDAEGNQKRSRWTAPTVCLQAKLKKLPSSSTPRQTSGPLILRYVHVRNINELFSACFPVISANMKSTKRVCTWKSLKRSGWNSFAPFSRHSHATWTPFYKSLLSFITDKDDVVTWVESDPNYRTRDDRRKVRDANRYVQIKTRDIRFRK